MTFSTTSGRVCLHEWDEPLLVDHVVSLLVDIRELRHAQVKRPLVILVIRTPALASGNASDVLPTAMPAILDGCEQLIVVAEPADARGSLLRSLFTGSSAAPLPPDIAGQIGSRYHLFGGVVRDNAGRVVRMLEPMARDAGQAARKDVRVAIVALAVAAVAGGSVYLYTRLNKRARLARKLEQVDEALAPALRNAELTREELATLGNAIADFLNVATSSTYRGVRLSVPELELQTLRTLAAALAEFSAGLRPTKNDDPGPPALPDESSDLLSLLASMRDQVEYQTGRWPVADA